MTLSQLDRHTFGHTSMARIRTSMVSRRSTIELILIDSKKKTSTKTSSKLAAGFELLRVRAPAKQTSRNKHC